jgi:hypothetical protein
MNKLDEEAKSILAEYLSYEKRITPPLSIWIGLSAVPLYLSLFLGPFNSILKIPYHPWGIILESVLGLYAASIVIGFIIRMFWDLAFNRPKNQFEIMAEILAIDHEYILKLQPHPIGVIKHFLSYLQFHLNVREKTNEM